MRSSGIILLWIGLAGIALASLFFWARPNKRGSFPSSGSVGDPGSDSSPIVLYCAAGIKPPVEAICREYENEYGIEIQIQYAGSGTLLSNLKVARRGDLYLAADDLYLEMARKEGLLREMIPLAKMTPVLGVQKGNPKKIQGIHDLYKPGVRAALANADAAAIGKVGKSVLAKAGIWDRVEAHVKVFKPTVNELANDLKIGAVDVSVLWDATANQYPEIDFISVPEFEAESRLISIGVLDFSREATSALKLARYIGSRDRGLPHFQKWGYNPVAGDKWRETPEVLLYSGGVNRMAIEETIKEFEAREGCKVTRVYNGCGILVAQIKAGERPDAYFACDVSFMSDVGDLFEGSRTLSRTDMVILTPKGNPNRIEGLHDLTKPGLKIGVANPKQSALGALTENLLASAGIRDAVFLNVKSQTPTADLLVNQLRAGSLDAVIVYRANTSQVTDLVEVLSIPLPNATAEQPYGVGLNSDHARLMGRLEDALISVRSRERFKSVGFEWVHPFETLDR